MADDIAGIVLEIPSGVLDNIEKADNAIKRLQATSETAAQKIKEHFDTTAVSGLNAFIRKVQEAQVELKGLSLPSGKGMDMGKIGSDAAKSASDINLLVQSLSQLTSALSKNKAVRTATKNVAPQETEYSKVTAELAKQTERYVQLSQAIAAYNQKKFEETTFSERTQNAANVAELQTLQQSIPLLRDKVALMERAKQAGVEAVNPNLETRRANAELAAMNKAYAEEEKASAKKAAQIEKDRQREAEAAKKSYEQQQKMYEKLFGKGGVADQQVLQSLANQKAKTLATAQGAMDYAKNARSLKDMTEAYRNLKTVMDKIDPKNPQWQQMNKVYLQTKQRIDEIRKAMGDFSSQSQRMSGIAGQLRNQLTAAFSVAAIKEYMSQMIKVRAQFELQNTALRAILQNKDEADRIFAQVQQMALQSPFTIMQLTTYTKQLAAYRVEANKLVGTTKMLADVSAGLGVDIQRLILAYGQVKSANYLRACLGRGTEIKTMRGIVKVEEIVVGDKLYNDHNEVTTVAELYSGTQQMYKFTELAPDGYSYRVNEAHILTMYDKLTNAVVDVKVLDYLQYPERYMGVRMSEGEICTYAVKCQKDIVDEYFGFKLDGNKRFQLVDGTITHNTEVRQFTEAGLNIAGELAQYFSELQGKMISVGDVMDMITKRMVRFEDVEEVFKRVTSAGGLFYDMQKKQSDSLFGQIQRIQDALSIMMNDIGKSNQGAISFMLQTIRSLISSWREIVPYMKIAVTTFGAYIVMGKMLPSIVSSLRGIRSAWIAITSATTGATGAMRAFSTVVKANPFGLVASAVAMLATYIWEVVSAQSALNEEMERNQTEAVSDMYQLIYRYRELADAVANVTTPYKERKEALDELKRTYKDILPDEMLEIENIQKMKGAYDEATEAIRAYTLEKLKQKQQDVMNKAMMESMEDAKKRLMSVANGFAELNDKIKNIPEDRIKGTINNIFTTLEAEVLSGTLSIEDMQQEFYQRFAKFFDLDNLVVPQMTKYRNFYWDLLGAGGQSIVSIFTQDGEAFKNYWARVYKDLDESWGALNPFGFITKDSAWEELSVKFQTIADEYGEMTSVIGEYESEAQRQMAESAQGQIQSFKKISTEISNFKVALSELYNLQRNNKLYTDKGGITEMGQSAYNSLIKALDPLNDYLTGIGKAPIYISEITASLTDNISQQEMFGKVATAVLGNFNAELQATAKNSGNTYLQGFSKNVNKALDEITGTNVQQKVADMEKRIVGALGGSLDMFDKIKVGAKDSFGTVRKSVEDNIKAAKELRESYDKIMSTSVYKDPKAVALDVTGLDEQQRKELDVQIKLLEALFGLLGGVEKQKTTKGKDPWQDRVSLIKEMNTEYEKLLKYYNESEVKLRIQKSYAEAVSEAFKGIKLNGKDLGDIEIWKGFDKQGMIEQLRNILDSGLTISKEKRAELQKMLAGFKATIDIEIQENRLEQLKQRFTDIFANYDLTKELGSLGVNIDLTYIVGGKPMTLAQARKELQDTYNKALAEGQLGEDAEKAYKDAMKKLADLEHKAQIEQLKNYNKYLLESMSERVQIEMKAQREIRKIRYDETLDDTTKQMAIMRQQQQMQADLAKQEWKDFQGSDLYISLFEDMEHASTQSLEYILAKLRSLKESLKELPADQLRAVMKQIESVEHQLYARDPFKALSQNIGTAIESFKGLKKASEDFQRANEQYEIAKRTRDDFALYTTELEEALSVEKARVGVNEFGEQIENETIKLLQKKIALRRKELDAMNENVEGLEKEKSALAKVVADFKKSKEAAGGALQEIGSWINETASAIGDIATSLENVFGTMSDGTRDTVESIQEILGGVGDMASGVGRFMAGDYIGGAMQTLKGLASTVGSIFAIGDKKKERQIKRLTEKVDELNKAYDNLHDAMEAAYTFDDYNVGYNASVKLLDEQKQAYEEMIRLEQAKKKSDKDKIKKYEDAIAELEKRRQELRDARYEEFGSIAEKGYQSEAEAYVSAWLDAFKETGDGLDALGNHWDEFFENLVMKQAAGQIVTTKMKKYIEQINAAIDSGDTGLSLAQTFAQIGQNLKDELGDWNEELKAFFDALGFKGGAGELVLSDLQKGIQNITEPQAAAIEAYMNSIRFAVFHHTEQLDTLITAIQAQYGGGDSPILVEVRAIRSILSNIDDRFRSITQSVTGRGLVLKVN